MAEENKKLTERESLERISNDVRVIKNIILVCFWGGILLVVLSFMASMGIK